MGGAREPHLDGILKNDESYGVCVLLSQGQVQRLINDRRIHCVGASFHTLGT